VVADYSRCLLWREVTHICPDEIRARLARFENMSEYNWVYMKGLWNSGKRTLKAGLLESITTTSGSVEALKS
jgi:hypothetical protein